MTKSYNISHFLSPDHTKTFRVCIWKVCLAAAKIIEVRKISVLSYRGYKSHSWIFSIFLNVSLSLVFCTAQKTILANKHNAKWKNEALWRPMNTWNGFGKQCISCHAQYRTLSALCIDSYGNRNSLITSEIDNIWIIMVWISNLTVCLKSLNRLLCLSRKFSLKLPVSWGWIFKWWGGFRY